MSGNRVVSKQGGQEREEKKEIGRYLHGNGDNGAPQHLGEVGVSKILRVEPHGLGGEGPDLEISLGGGGIIDREALQKVMRHGPGAGVGFKVVHWELPALKERQREELKLQLLGSPRLGLRFVVCKSLVFAHQLLSKVHAQWSLHKAHLPDKSPVACPR